MLEVALKLLRKLSENGFQAYIVGGFVRDHLLGIESNDIDICTSAKPMEIRSIFKEACLPNDEYGSVTVIVKNIRFEITTFRKEYAYYNHRKPMDIEFIDNLKGDLIRRDFLMNTLCMDDNSQIIDLLNGKKDLETKIIHAVGNSYDRLTEDALRILRAIRFSTNLGFKLSADLRNAIIETKGLLRTLSYERKREELDKIFTSIHVQEGISLLLELGLAQELELGNLEKISHFDDLLGVWAQISIPESTYRFTNNEKELIDKIQKALLLDNYNPIVLYHYGLYVNSIAGAIKGLDKKEISQLYNSLPIKSMGEMEISGSDILLILQKEPGKYIRSILEEIEKKILKNELENNRSLLLHYVEQNYS